MDDNHRIRNAFTVCKFIVNTDNEKSRNRIITKTLGKFGVINMDYRGPCPKHDELWYVRIDKEIKAGEPAGCLVLTPIMQLNIEQVDSLIPGTGASTESIEGGVCYVTPNNTERYYMIPIGYRKAQREARFTICVHRGYPSSGTGTAAVAHAGPLTAKPEAVATGNPYGGSTGWTPEAVAQYEAERKEMA